MKRYSLFLLSIIAACVLSVSADASEKVTRRQIDTLVARSMRPYQIFSGFLMFKSLDSDNRKEDKLALEYLMFRHASMALYEEMKELPAADVGRMIKFTGTNVFNRLVSVEFWRKYQRFVAEAEQDKKYDFTIRDEQYADLAGRLADDYGYLVSRAGALAKGSIRPHNVFSTGDGWLKPLAQRVRDKLPLLLIKNFMWFFTYDEFVSSGVEYGTFLGPMAEKIDAASVVMKDPKVAERIDSLLNSPEAMEDIAEYMRLAHNGLPTLARKYGQLIDDVPYGKGTYSGQAYDGRPEGHGTWTDRKGKAYTGDFRSGKRHGRIEMTKPGEKAVVQCWYKGKQYKSVKMARNADGSVPEVASIGGKKFGYGYVYDPGTRKAQEGYFIDGELHGNGWVDTPELTVSGVFCGDAVSNCRIVWKGTKWKECSFTGEKNGNLLAGSMTRILKDGAKTECSLGAFVDGQEEGPCLVQIVRKNDTTAYLGQYAYGRMYGEGVFTWVLGRSKTAERQHVVYEGNTFRYKPHGKGSVKVELCGVTDESFNISRFGVRLREYVGEKDATIRIEGYFKDGNLVEGKVIVSNGTFMIGRFADGRLAEGRMLKKYKDGSSYDGECRDGKYHGYGKVTYADGSVREGYYENGKAVPGYQKKSVPEDVPVFVKNEQTRSFRFDDLSGQKGVVSKIKAAGVILMIRGQTSVEVDCKGFFQGDVMTRGKVEVSDGSWLEGTFEDGVLIKGKGRTYDKYGTIYTGDIKNGFPHGSGECLYKDGTVFKGHFANGNRMQGTHYAADGKVIKVYR